MNGFINSQNEFAIQNRQCESKDEFEDYYILYREKLENVFKALPSELNSMLCDLKIIFIEKEFFNGSASFRQFLIKSQTDIFDLFGHQKTIDQYNVDGWILSFAQNVFDSDYDWGEWALKKELTLFVDNQEDIQAKVEQSKIKFHVKSNGRLSDNETLLFYLMIHEMGHYVDYDYLITRGMFHLNWNSFSWEKDGKINFISKFWSVNTPCYYFRCKTDKLKWEPYDFNDMEVFYSRFVDQSGFVSPYAAVNPKEDFAESFTYFILGRPDSPITSLNLEVNNRSYDLIDRWKNSVNTVIVKKRKFFENLFTAN